MKDFDPENPRPLISIIIPVYNRIGLVFQAIESALAQTYRNKEVVVVDDGSNDGTYEALQASHAPIILCRHPENRGQSAARNLGVHSCKGEYVLFLDSDDYLEQTAVESLWRCLHEAEKEDPSWGVSYGKRLTCNADLGEVRVKPRKYYSGHILPQLFFDNFVRTGTYLVRKSILAEVGGFREDLRVQEDLNLLFLIAARYRFLFVDEGIAKYRRHTGMRARDYKMSMLGQGTRHIDYFFQDTPAISPAISRAKNKLYAKEHLLLSKTAWRVGLREQCLYHWKAAYSYRKSILLYPKYLARALVCFVNRGDAD